MTTRTFSQSRSWIRYRLAIGEHPNLYFWLLFIILNGLLFLPSYLLNRQSTTFFPILSITATDPTRALRQFLVWRNNLDIFRLSAELTILMAVWVLLPWQQWRRPQRLARWLIGFTYLLALTYAIYESSVLYLYQEEAVFYAHALMLFDGMEFLMRHLPVQLWLVIIAALAVAAGFLFLLTLIRIFTGGIPRQRLNTGSKALLVALALLSLLSVARYGDNLTSPKSVVSSLAFKLRRNTAASLSLYQKVGSLDGLTYSQFYDYSGYDLLDKPDIYLIFIESYGSVLYQKPSFVDSYTQLLADLEDQLGEQGWQATSALSESPSWGGGSWMAYTSALFGMRVDSHPQYTALLERFQDEAYPDLGYTLRSQGYEYIRATSLAAELPDEEWQEYVNFFGVDRWIRYRDLDYQGTHYGWGPSPPDQYVLNALHEEVNIEGGRPFLLFWITQNSHYPWRKVPAVVDNWRALNDGKALVTLFDDDKTSLAARQENYLTAITYELSFLTDFILKQADDNAVFILIGDHQPGYITRRSDGFDTPLHIISKDGAFLEKFAAYGFETGLLVKSPKAAIRHEGFYSLFMRSLLEQYGHGSSQLPPYFPGGVTADRQQQN